MRFAAAVAIAAALAASRPAVAGDDCGLEDPAVAAAAGPVPRKVGERAVPEAAVLAPVRRMRPAGRLRYGQIGHARAGALAGKTIYLSAGHGFTWVASLGRWATQRGNTHDLVEDLVSTETVAQYLVPLLQSMGAHVITVRETDLSAEQSIVDDGDTAFTTEGLSPADGPAGWGRLATPIADAANPFAAGGSRVIAAMPEETGRVRWTFDVPSAGDFDVFVGWVQDPTRASDAHYIVRHTGGETHFRVDQRRHGGTWVRLGRFHFAAGSSADRGAVLLVDDSADAGSTLSADVARIGGGVGIIDRGGGTSGRPMFENAARYYTQLAGAPSTVWDYSDTDGNDDVGTRSRFAAWEHEDGEDAVYVAWHTNAPSPARGTSSFAYGPSSFGPLSEFTGVPGSLELMDAVHGELVADLRASWEADWQDRGQHTAYFGEVNPNHNPEMPAALFEIAFHDTDLDADALRDPRFRYLAARAIAQGIARYFAIRDGAALTLPPEPPATPRMSWAGGGMLRIAWDAPVADPAAGDPPDGYRVYLSRDGLGFDEGTPAAAPELLIPAPTDGGPVYARVTATNAGGESLPGRVVGARAPGSGTTPVLVVAGFDRLDRFQVLPEDLSAWALGSVDRVFVDRINDGSHVARHGDAIAAAGFAFDSAAAGAVAAGAVDLTGYRAVIWQLGEESLCCEPLPAAERAAIATYLAGGGKLMISGSEGFWTLAIGGAEEQAFLTDTLHAVFVADDAESFTAAAAGPPFDGMAPVSFDDDGPGGYPVEFPDVLAPGPGGSAALDYDGGAGGAAVWWTDPAGGAVLLVGFPFETIAGAGARAEFMARVLAGFGLEPDIDQPDDPLGGCGCRGGGVGGWLLAVGLLAALRRRRA